MFLDLASVRGLVSPPPQDGISRVRPSNLTARDLPPDKSIRYQHIDVLFGDEIDWDLIATHARDMIQVVLSIQAGRVMPSMLLRKLGTYNRKSLLYRAFRELGRVERTLFLLRFISSAEVRRVIRAETTKIETYM